MLKPIRSPGAKAEMEPVNLGADGLCLTNTFSVFGILKSRAKPCVGTELPLVLFPLAEAGERQSSVEMGFVRGQPAVGLQLWASSWLSFCPKSPQASPWEGSQSGHFRGGLRGMAQ